MLRDQVRTVDGGGKVDTVFEVNEPSGLGFLADGRVLIVARRPGSLLIGMPGEAPAELSALTAQGVTGVNDLVADTEGRSYIGSLGAKYQMGDEYREWNGPAPGVVLCVMPTGEWTVAARNLANPNGMVITPDGHTLIVAETYRYRLTAFDRDDDGKLSNPRTHAAVESGFPDGLALDADGAVWVGAGEQFSRFDSSGTILDRVAVPDWRCIACALGGSDRKTLFLAVAKMTMESFLRRESEGRILAVDVDTPGAGLP
jgi:sugar lactone lactonase YvrE